MILFKYPPVTVSTSSEPLKILVDGVETDVEIDTVTPANTVAVPVEIYGASGPINITAGDINVQLSDVGVNFDRTRIGDGTNQWAINSSSEGLVRDASSVALLTTIDADTSSLAGTVATDGAAHPSTGIIVGGQNGSGLFRHLSVTNTGVVNVTGPLTDTQLRASAVPVSMASAPLPTGAATETTLSSINTKTPALVSGRVPVDGSGVTQPISASSLPLPTGAATETTLSAINTKLPATLGRKINNESLAVVLSTEQQTIIQDTLNSLDLLRTNTGPTNATAPGTDTATSDINGRLQRIAQRLTSLIAQLPSALGQTNMAGSLSVTIANNQSTVPVSVAAPSAVTVKQAQITVGTSAVRLTTDGSAPSSTRIRLDFRPSASSTARFFYGSSGVTTSNGLEIFPGESVQMLNDVNDYYIISNTAAQTVGVVESE